jgi:hypothetical protein
MSAAGGARTEPEPPTDRGSQMPRVFLCPHALDPRAADARRDRQAVRRVHAGARRPLGAPANASPRTSNGSNSTRSTRPTGACANQPSKGAPSSHRTTDARQTRASLVARRRHHHPRPPAAAPRSTATPRWGATAISGQIRARRRPPLPLPNTIRTSDRSMLAAPALLGAPPQHSSVGANRHTRFDEGSSPGAPL